MRMTGCIYLAANSASLEITISCKTVKPVIFWVFCYCAVFLLLKRFLPAALHWSCRSSCNSTGYPITAVYSRVRLAFHSLDRRSLSAFAADMRPQQLRSVCSLIQSNNIECLKAATERLVSLIPETDSCTSVPLALFLFTSNT